MSDVSYWSCPPLCRPVSSLDSVSQSRVDPPVFYSPGSLWPRIGVMETNSGTPIPFHVNHGAATRGMLERTVGFLEKRDGVDKVLKIARYSVRLLLATGAVTSPAATRALKDTERGLGSSRKAYRIGKFLRCVGALRKQRRLVPSISSSVLEGTAAVGEGVYYFVDQFQFLVSVGVLSGRQGRHLTKVSSVAELVFCSSVGIGLDLELDRRASAHRAPSLSHPRFARSPGFTCECERCREERGV